MVATSHYQLTVGTELFSPLFIGAMVATYGSSAGVLLQRVLSVPFSSGQWLLHGREFEASRNRVLSVPFSSGQWLLLNCKKMLTLEYAIASFSPLFIGAMVATTIILSKNIYVGIALSVPFSSGQWLLQTDYNSLFMDSRKLSVPFSSRQWLLLRPRSLDCLPSSFSPLFIGQWLLQRYRRIFVPAVVSFQSPFHRAMVATSVLRRW